VTGFITTCFEDQLPADFVPFNENLESAQLQDDGVVCIFIFSRAPDLALTSVSLLARAFVVLYSEKTRVQVVSHATLLSMSER
jgi:hypothetical protein